MNRIRRLHRVRHGNDATDQHETAHQQPDMPPSMQHPQPLPMEGVFEYLPSHTMTAEERARYRMPKRERENKADVNQMQAPAAAAAAANSNDQHMEYDQVLVEQDSFTLMEGDMSVWGHTNQTRFKKSDSDSDDTEAL